MSFLAQIAQRLQRSNLELIVKDERYTYAAGRNLRYSAEIIKDNQNYAGCGSFVEREHEGPGRCCQNINLNINSLLTV